jgi:hypothetical protein
MWLKSILIDKAEIKKISNDKWELHLEVLSLDENNDLEPNVSLKLYINNELVKTLISDEVWEANATLLVDIKNDNLKLQIKDISEKIKSKVKIIFDMKVYEDPWTVNTTQINHIVSDDAREESIIKLKSDPNNIRWLSPEQRNDASIVKYALMQK